FGPGGGPGRLDGLYVSGERRAQQTAAPLEELLHLGPTGYDTREASATAINVLSTHEGGTVLVLRGSSALQPFLQQVAGAGRAGEGWAHPDLLYTVSVPS